MLKKTIFFTIPIFIAFSCFATANNNLEQQGFSYSFGSNSRNYLKIDCDTNFYKKYGIEHSLLEAMSYAYLGDINIEKTMQSNHNDKVGFGISKKIIPYIEEKTGFNEEDLKTSYCANYEVMAWFMKNHQITRDAPSFRAGRDSA